MAVLLLGCSQLLACDHRAAAPETVTPAHAQAWRYDARLAPDLSALHVRVCFDGAAPERLVPVRGEPGEWTERAVDARGRELDVDDDAIDLDGVGAGECVRYTARLDRAARRTRQVQTFRADVMATQAAWLWRPQPMPRRAKATLRLHLPDGIDAATPWPRAPDGDYLLDRSALTLSAHVAFGRFEQRELRVPGGRLRLARLDGPLAADRHDLRRWLHASASAVATLYGRLPVDEALVIVAPVGRGPDPVAFGRVRRGGGPSVVLLVRENATLERLLADWVAVHELSHLALPLLERGDAWISEGIATYYQEVLRARAGLQPPLRAWQRMDAGFARARAAGTGRTLRDEAEHMRETGAHRRVYWAGAAFALQLDLRLRQRTDGRESLDSALAGIRELGAQRPGPWTGERLLRLLDRVTGTKECSGLGARHAHGRELPELDPLFGSLGLVRGPDHQLTPAGQPARARLRERITRPPDAALARARHLAPAAAPLELPAAR